MADTGLEMQPDRVEKLGPFIGVFTPSVLTILGVILYLRTGWVVGNVGLPRALLIVTIANAITLLTSLSVSAVSTNMRVRAGGAYYIISRSLGLEIGAAIGIPLFLAQALSVTLYAFGLAESLRYVWPDVEIVPVAAGTVVVVALLAGRGASLALRLQLPIVAAIGASLGALAIGVSGRAPDIGEVAAGIEGGESFWVVFAVFFPAVTGIMAGISLSGDLRDPQRSIPRGTLAAVLTGFAVYLAVPVLLAVAATSQELVDNELIWFDIAGPTLSWFIFPGLWGAIFSSAVGSILGAPRTIEALVKDGALPGLFARGKSVTSGFGVSLLLSTGTALAAVLLGDLNTVAPVLSMFFLITYGVINLVAGLGILSGELSYRPTLRIPWWLSLAGSAACFWVMFVISPLAFVVAISIEAAIYVAVRRRRMTASFGDLRRSALLGIVRSTLLRLAKLPQDPRNWRPNVLVFAGDVSHRAGLVRFGSWLVQDRGILTVAKLVVGELSDHAADIPQRVASLHSELEELGVAAFAEVDVVKSFEEGAIAVSQANGIAGIDSNTLMFGWSSKPARRAGMLRIIRQVGGLGKSAVICKVPDGFAPGVTPRIDVWWGGLQQNGDLMVLLAHLLTLNPAWRGASMSIKSIASSPESAARSEEALERMIKAARVNSKFEVILKPADKTVSAVIQTESGSADVVLLGLSDPPVGEEEIYAERLALLVEGLDTVLLVRNAGSFRGQLLGEELRVEEGSRD
ncbi:MAG: Na-K-Cl cotransporter [Acidimicrobiia bacterium]|nr:Na-K-Cl cotransporter [Acidimicrobiia bacterium]NNL28066.1 Na-K-Cl cotransporter [Acidimicrobiia bacterium]